MVYPTISEYIESIKYAEDNFATLTNLRPVLDEDGNPIMSSGNFAVVFKMQDFETKDFYAVKCFTREQDGRKEAYKKIAAALKWAKSDYLVDINYLDYELFVNTPNSDESEYPILIMDWVEGITLDKYILKFHGNSFVLHDICVSFNSFCKWLISQNFAHGDIKPDNILVRPNGSLVLVDYDGMYTYEMNGQKAREIGSENYRHPMRTIYDFNKHIDDFSLAAISLSLKAISISYGILDNTSADEAFIFTRDDYCSIKDSPTFKLLNELAFEDVSLMQYISTFMLAYNKVALSEHSFEFGEVPVSKLLKPYSNYFFTRKDEPIDNAGVIYSHDGKCVLSFDYDKSNEIDIHIKEGVICICEGAFSSYKSRKLNLYLPKSLRFFSKNSFSYSYNKLQWFSPWFTYQNGIIYSSDFTSCILQHLKDVEIDERVIIIERSCFSSLDVSNLLLPSNLEIIRENAFNHASTKPDLVFPNCLQVIEDSAFSGVSTIESITFGNNIVAIGKWCFAFCKNLSSIHFSPHCKLVEIPEKAFHDCYNLSSVSFPKLLKRIGNEAFQWCHAITFLDFPDTLVSIGEAAFNMNGKSSMRDDGDFHSKLKTLYLPKAVNSIGNSAFKMCESLEHVVIDSSSIALGDYIFEDCFGLRTFEAPFIKKIPIGFFMDCKELTETIIPEVLAIQHYAFKNCEQLEFIIPPNCSLIEPGAFNGIKSIVPNQCFIYYNDLLLSSDRTKLLSCNCKAKYISIPEGVVDIEADAFHTIPEYISLPNSISDKSIENLLYLPVQYVQIPLHRKIEKKWDFRAKLYGSDKVWFDEFGVVYSADKTTLLKFPMSIEIQSYKTIEGCVKIEDEAFEGDEDCDPEFGMFYAGNELESLILSEGIKHIGYNALCGCRKIKSIVLPDSLETLDDQALEGCHSIKVLQLPKLIKTIGKNALPSNLVSISSRSQNFMVINNCLLSRDIQLIWLPPVIEELQLPKEIIYKGQRCHTYNNCIVSMNGSLLWTIPNIEHFDFPIGVKSIAKGAFAYNKSIKTIIIPEGVQSIENEAFWCNQNLTSIYLPSTIIAIGGLKSYQGWGRKYIEFFYPEEIHIPKHMKRHFMNLLPGISDKTLIDDYN